MGHHQTPIKPLFLLCFIFIHRYDVVSTTNSDKSALLEFKRSVSDPYGLLTTWNESNPDLCSWVGVTCGSGHRVVGLNITGGGNFGSFTCNKYDQFQLYGFGIRKSCEINNGKLMGKLSYAISTLDEIRVLSLPFNDLEGEIGSVICGLKKLEVVDLEGNMISGNLKFNFGDLKRLRVVNLGFNRISGEIPDSLSNLKTLKMLNLAGNRLNGSIPRFVNGELRGLYLSFNRISGRIPSEIGYDCGELERLELAGNLLLGGIPSSLSNCSKLRSVLLYSNMLQGEIPGELGRLKMLEVLDVSRNSLRGQIPKQLGNCTEMSVLVLSNLFDPIPDVGSCSVDEYNYFQSELPLEITVLPKLKLLWAPRTTLEGGFPSNWGGCKSLEMVNLARNFFTGEIPNGLTLCKKLRFLDLSSNKLTGELSDELPVPCMILFDVSKNHLSGPILSFRYTTCEPFDASSVYTRYFAFQSAKDGEKGSLANTTRILRFNVSYNDLSGPLQENLMATTSSVRQLTESGPTNGGNFVNYSDSSTPAPKSRNGNFSSIEIASIVSASAIFSVLLALIVLYFCTRRRPKSVANESIQKEVTLFIDIGLRLNFDSVIQATGHFNASNCIGSGGFGATYKAEISPGFLVAIKRLAVGRFQGVQQFEAEIRTLGRHRHRNLVTLIGYHASETEMFLIYNYLPGGNLERFIQERSMRAVDWRVLHKIALDVARALAYLHDQCVPRVLHRDVKPSNILLDDDLNAYLSDFGLARLLGTSETHATTGVAGTFGYVAPEYAMTCRVSDKADVYSYGVVLLELLSDKKALDPSFSSYGNGFNIVAWALMLLQEGRAKEFFTAGLWDAGPHDDLVEVLHLAVVCTVDSLSTRPTMKQVVRRLKQLQPRSC
ncbi:putative protein kinase RLK-Pelle-LRR-XV family [Helianthus debilis subsp. tardiflorus]